MEFTQYEKEQNDLLLNYLLTKEKNEYMMEFIITPQCNQSCEYCYLFKHKDEMYPPESYKKENVLENFPILIDWLEENGFTYGDYDIFSGEFFNVPYWEDLFQIIYDHEEKMNQKDEERRHHVVTIPSNCSFLSDDKKTERVEFWIKKFPEVNCELYISASVDGPDYLEKIERPFNDPKKQKDDEFYDKFFKFRKKYQMSSHPMVTKNFVKNYKENYDWWIDNTIKHNIIQKNYAGEEVYAIPMLLEVRDPNQWDEESLQNYKKLLLYIAEKDVECLHKGDITDFAYRVFDGWGDNIYRRKGHYTAIQPYIIGYPYVINKMPCSIQGGAVFRVGDLAYVPCHRTCYDHFVYGNLIKEDGKITGLKARRAALALKIKQLNPNRSVAHCAGCPISGFCLKGCLGSQFENTNSLFCAQDEICKMYLVKYKTIHEIALKYGLYDILKKDKYIPQERKEYIAYARQRIEQL